MKKIKNLTAAEILKQIKLTVICGEEIEETNVCDGFSTWMEQFDASNPYEAFTPESREYFQNKLFVAFAAGMLPAEVTETRTNEVGPDGCWVFAVETSGTLNPYEETEEETEETETTAPADDPEAVTLAPAEDAQVWDENGDVITPDTDTDTDTEEKEEDKTMTTNKLYLSNWDYNAALIIEELATIVENNGGTVKPGTETIIENRALDENMRKAADRLTQLEHIETDNPGTNEHRTDAIKRLRADIEKWERIDNTPRTVHHCTWSSAYISFKLGGMYYYYQTDSNPFFDFHYMKTQIDVNGTVSRCVCLENDPKEWLWDCFLRAEATDADRREAANLIYNMLIKAAPSVIRRDSRRVRVRNQYDGRYHYETIYEKERREAVNF